MNKQTFLKKIAHQFVPNVGTIILILGLFFGREMVVRGMLNSTSTTTISYQGRLADSANNPVTNAGLGMAFRLYNASTGGSALWTETYAGVAVNNGLFHVLLGSTNPIPASLFSSNNTLYLGITIGGDSEMTPREQLASAPYAMQASQALTVSDASITTAKIVDGAVTRSKLSADIYTPLIQSGSVGADINTGGFTLGSGTGVRTYSTHITFGSSFGTAIPNVIVGIQFIDSDQRFNTRIVTSAVNITSSGFDLTMTTSADSVVYGLGVNWIAYK